MKERRGLSLPTVVLVVFIILKLVGVIAWSWWWVLSPLWIPIALWLFLVLIVASVKALRYGKTKQ
jgi:uncharacterized protein (DUF983 family)